MSKSKSILENGRIAQEEVDEVVNMALSSLKSLMADYETPIELRLQISLRLFEIFGCQEKKTSDEKAIVNHLEKNSDSIEENARRLSNLRLLLEQLTQEQIINNHLETSGFSQNRSRERYHSLIR